MDKFFAVVLVFLLFFPLFSTLKGQDVTYLVVIIGLVIIFFWKKLRGAILQDTFLKTVIIINYTVAIVFSFNIINLEELDISKRVFGFFLLLYIIILKNKIVRLSELLCSQSLK
ncbi:hypothetical protein [Pseudoalteromonas arctica]|uniref:Uncharacterized protein n=1 Tax=Pseudoalteromonas arctica TaxID=394751 RepID=A0A7Y0HBL8_9GAMM|nr:hypothetical protein [Pseudoalteromonas arctica]NMM41705.1 hypothetical protein [Pseudoalteromonas arctica]